MKKKIMIALGIVFVIAIGMIAIIQISGFANRPDGTTDVMEFSEVKGLVLLKGYTQEEIEEKLKGEHRDNILVSWGEPDGMLHGRWGDVWFLDETESKKITVYYDSDGCVESVIIRGNEEVEMIDYSPMIMFNDVLYVATDYSGNPEEFTLVGKIESYIDSGVPTENNQANSDLTGGEIYTTSSAPDYIFVLNNGGYSPYKSTEDEGIE